MGYLEQFARNRRRSERTKVLTARIPESLYDSFQDYCDDLGLSLSEAVLLLVEREMEGFEGSYNEVTTTIEYEVKHDELERNSNEDEIVKPKKNVVKNTSETGAGRFTTTRWKVNKMLPCPLCRDWKSASNFKRHVEDTHDLVPEQIFTNPEYVEIADRMVEEKNRSI